jgi:hypothetical protein
MIELEGESISAVIIKFCRSGAHNLMRWLLFRLPWNHGRNC